MAKLLKERARKPVIEDAQVFAHTRYFNDHLHLVLEIGEPWDHGKETRYVAALTQAEAMRIMSEWLKVLAKPS